MRISSKRFLYENFIKNIIRKSVIRNVKKNFLAIVEQVNL